MHQNRCKALGLILEEIYNDELEKVGKPKQEVIRLAHITKTSF